MQWDHSGISECTQTESRQDNQLETAADLVVMAVMAELAASATVAMVAMVAMVASEVLVQVNTW